MISIQEAREILGEKDVSDEEIQELLDNLYYLAERVLNNEL